MLQLWEQREARSIPTHGNMHSKQQQQQQLSVGNTEANQRIKLHSGDGAEHMQNAMAM